MPAERLSMRKVREVLRLRHVGGASVRMIARSVGVGHTTVAEYLRRAAVIEITWPVPAEFDDAELERRLFTPAGFHPVPTRAMPDWNHVHAELRRRGVTLSAGVAPGLSLPPTPLFSKVVRRPMFRNGENGNTFENPIMPRSAVWSACTGGRQKRWLERTADPASNSRIPLADNVSTRPASLSANPSRKPLRLRAQAPIIASGYS